MLIEADVVKGRLCIIAITKSLQQIPGSLRAIATLLVNPTEL
ncbi:hypothetical protein [Gloeocapsopsis dulcis]|nr:hypothetical protein [Gloeocapsopsis dulcis]WNN89436.1 hypothetical protein P0S91_24920 [Gloeocapsopsis dulcis]